MKKLILIGLSSVFIIVAIKAQSNESIMGQLNFNTGAYVFTDLAINQTLKQNKIPVVNSVNVFTSWNVAIEYNNFYVMPELGLGFSSSKEDQKSTVLNSLVGSVSIGYILSSYEICKLKVGGILSYMPSKLSMYDNNVSVDLNDLNFNNQTGKLELNVSPLMIGMYLGTELFQNTSFPFGFDLTYQLNLIDSRWTNNYGETNNPINEKTSIISARIFIPITKWNPNR